MSEKRQRWTKVDVWLVLQEGRVSSCHDSPESAQIDADKLKGSRVDGPWILHSLENGVLEPRQ
jgi:hypothetical protein